MVTFRAIALITAASCSLGACQASIVPSEADPADPGTWTWADGDVGFDLVGTGRGQAIFNGTIANQPHHEAVVSLNQRYGSQVSPNIFCSGTLIAADTVLTAGHCVQGSAANNIAGEGFAA